MRNLSHVVGLLAAACVCAALMWLTVGHGENRPVLIVSLIVGGVVAAVAAIVFASVALTYVNARGRKALAVVGIVLAAVSIAPIGLALLAWAIGVGVN